MLKGLPLCRDFYLSKASLPLHPLASQITRGSCEMDSNPEFPVPHFWGDPSLATFNFQGLWNGVTLVVNVHRASLVPRSA